MNRACLAFTLAFALAFASPAGAYEAATHAGLTERAALAATLHQRLIAELGHPLGLYETLKMSLGKNEVERELDRRLSKLDPEGGYAPDGGRQTVLGWLVAGAVLEGVPASRTRNHFFDPTRATGLDQDGGSFRTRVGAAVSGIGTLRGIFTGANFDGSGRSSLEWLAAPREVNDWGLARFLDERERAVRAATPEERDDALARALVAAGAIAHLIEDAGDPAFVHDDWHVALASEGAPYEQWVASRYGRLAVPGPSSASLARAHLFELIHDGAGQGLADRTARRFYSPGSLPAAGAEAPPALQPPEAASGYVGSAEVAHLAAYRREPAGIFYWLDERCHHDYADALLPEIGRSVVTAIELLFRGKLEIADDEGKLVVRAAELPLGKGRVSLFADDDKGNRRLVAASEVSSAAAGDVILTAPAEAGKHLAALFRGVDASGEPIVVEREATLP
jgi:hypothetical protein